MISSIVNIVKARPRSGFFFVALALLVTAPRASCAAGAAVLLEPGFSMAGIRGGYEILEDRGGLLRIGDVATPAMSDSFVMAENFFSVKDSVFSACWIRFAVRNGSSADTEWYLELASPLLEQIDVYRVNDRGEVSDSRHAGRNDRFGDREIDYRNFVFRFIDSPHEASTLYIRARSGGSMIFPVSIWSPEKFHSSISREYVFLGIFCGAILVMLLYNLFLYFSVRDPAYLSYVFYYTCFLMFQLSMTGLSFQYLWPDSAWWARKSLPVFGLLSLIFSLNLCRVFLRMGERLRGMNILFLAVMILEALLLPLSFFSDYRGMTPAPVALAALTALLVSIALVRSLMMGLGYARFYAMACGFFWITVVSGSLNVFYPVPDIFIIKWGMHLASLAEVCLLSLALADRNNYFRSALRGPGCNIEDGAGKRTGDADSVLVRMEKRDSEMRKELELAADIQQGILPQMPWSAEGINIEAHTLSMGRVGGDFYDVFRMQGGHTGVLIADASGHGMPAAFITALAKISFSEAIRTRLFPGDIFINVNNQLVNAIKTDDFVTAFLMVISPSYEVFYCNASHMRPIVMRRRDLSTSEWDTNGLFMGAILKANDMYEDGRDALDFGDRVVLFTDGLSEAVNASGEKFSTGRIGSLLVSTSDLPLEQVKKHFIKEWNDFTAGSEQADDVTFVLVEINARYRELVDCRNRGFKLLSAGDHTGAIVELRKALDIDPSDEKTNLYIGECYLNTRAYAGAVRHLVEYLNRNEIDANVWCHLAEAHFNLENYQEAHRAAQKALQFRNRFARAMEILAMSFKKLERYREANQIWKRLLAMDSGNEIALREMEESDDDVVK